METPSKAAAPEHGASTKTRRIGVDENGLGAQLGPLVVTAVLANVTDAGTRFLSRKLPARFRAELDDSKALVSTHDVSLGEAWTRVLVEYTSHSRPASPSELFAAISLEGVTGLRGSCPGPSEPQCFRDDAEVFESKTEQLASVRTHIQELAKRGVTITRVASEVVCSSRLNGAKLRGHNRFVSDLHAMERLVLGLGQTQDRGDSVQAPLVAVCGKVGGMMRYEPFFGPLAGRLHVALEESQARSAYHFPGLGELRFLRDADAHDPLVMLSSLVGKYVRELFMRRIARFYPDATEASLPSGYHDPVTERFVLASQPERKRLGVVDDCFVRLRDEVAGQPAPVAAPKTRAKQAGTSGSRKPTPKSAATKRRSSPRTSPQRP